MKIGKIETVELGKTFSTIDLGNSKVSNVKRDLFSVPFTTKGKNVHYTFTMPQHEDVNVWKWKFGLLMVFITILIILTNQGKYHKPNESELFIHLT